MLHIVNENKKTNSIAIGGWFVRGSFNDEENKAGEHHFLEHILFNTPEVRNLTVQIKDRGLTTNAFTSHELMCFYVVCLEDSFKMAYEYIHYLLSNQLNLSGDVGFENERTIIKREIEYHFNFIEEMKRCLLIQMFENSNANFAIMGNKESVNRIEQEDLIDVYDAMFNGNKFITIASCSPCVNSIEISECERQENSFKKIIVTGTQRYIEDSLGSEYCYYGISYFFDKEYRNTGQVYAEYLKEELFTKLREDSGLTYRISSSNMNLAGGLISFWIFKIRCRDIEAVKNVVQKLFSQKLDHNNMKKYADKLRVKNLLHSDNITSEMLALGYGNSILGDEKMETLDWDAFYSYLEKRRGDYYQRIIGIGTRA